ncbi:MAG: hypothetical protein QXO15_06945 [Nitrososphaerota archaeon]
MSHFSFSRGRTIDVKMLGPEWRHRMIDVCGVGRFIRGMKRDVFVTHLDSDHLPLREYIAGSPLRFCVASPLINDVQRLYGKSFDFVEYLDYIELKHTTVHSVKKRFTERAHTCILLKMQQ